MGPFLAATYHMYHDETRARNGWILRCDCKNAQLAAERHAVVTALINGEIPIAPFNPALHPVLNSGGTPPIAPFNPALQRKSNHGGCAVC